MKVRPYDTPPAKRWLAQLILCPLDGMGSP